METKASQGCSSINTALCAKIPAAFQGVCGTIVTKLCSKVVGMIEQAWPPEKICDSIGFCNTGYRCGCLPDGQCATAGAGDCCSGKIHATATCPATLTGGGRCGCVPKDSCAQVSTDCCSGSYHKTLKCGGGVVGGRCN